MKKELSTTTLKIKPKTAKVFRKYARQLGKQQSETLQLMLEFFETNGISPMENMGPKITTLEKRIKVRINTVVAILKDIEKTQTKPTHAMIQLLFQEKPSKRKEILVEKNSTVPKRKSYPLENLSSYPGSEVDLQKKLTETSQNLNAILEKVEVVNTTFGKSHLRLNMSKSEFEELKLIHKRTQ